MERRHTRKDGTVHPWMPGWLGEVLHKIAASSRAVTR